MQRTILKLWPASLVVCILAMPAAVLGWPAEPFAPAASGTAERQSSTAESPAASDANLREGTELRDLIGTFQLLDGRLVFCTAANRYPALENLNLERIARLVDDQSQASSWSVSGTVTEFQGTNFLLIRRALRKNQRPAAGL